MSDEKKDWGEYEKQGVPVKEFFVAMYDVHFLPGEFRAQAETWMEVLAEIWLEHHPNGVSSQGDVFPSLTQDPAWNLSIYPNATCNHPSLLDPAGYVHTCKLLKGHEPAPHQDDKWAWYSADPRPFRKALENG